MSEAGKKSTTSSLEALKKNGMLSQGTSSDEIIVLGEKLKFVKGSAHNS